MNLTLLTFGIFVLVVLFLLVVVLLVWLRRRAVSDQTPTMPAGNSPRPISNPFPEPTLHPSQAQLPVDLLTEVQSLVASGRKIEAIKRVRIYTEWGLKDAKEFVDGLSAQGFGTSFQPQSTDVDRAAEWISATKGRENMDTQVRELLKKGLKIEAVKLVREQTNWGLKQSKDYVDVLEGRG